MDGLGALCLQRKEASNFECYLLLTSRQEEVSICKHAWEKNASIIRLLFNPLDHNSKESQSRCDTQAVKRLASINKLPAALKISRALGNLYGDANPFKEVAPLHTYDIVQSGEKDIGDRWDKGELVLLAVVARHGRWTLMSMWPSIWLACGAGGH